MTRLGKLAVERGFLAKDDLVRTLRRQAKLRERHALDVKVGELLVARGELTLEQLVEILEAQKLHPDGAELARQVHALREQLKAIKRAQQAADESGEQRPADWSFLAFLEQEPDEALRVIRRKSEAKTPARDR